MLKTFATAHLGFFKDINLITSIMWQEVGDVLFQDYHGMMKPKGAAEFWKILPSDSDLTLEAAP